MELPETFVNLSIRNYHMLLPKTWLYHTLLRSCYEKNNWQLKSWMELSETFVKLSIRNYSAPLPKTWLHHNLPWCCYLQSGRIIYA